MSSWISQILPPVWSTMTSSADKYVKNVVNDTGDEEEIVDSDGEVLGKNLWIRGLLGSVHYDITGYGVFQDQGYKIRNIFA